MAQERPALLAAIAAVDPSADRLKDVRERILFAERSLQDLARFYADMKPAGEARVLLQEFAYALRKAELAGATLPPIFQPLTLLRALVSSRRAVESLAASLQIHKGSKQRDRIKSNARDLARDILIEFNKRPTKTRKGQWHRLANALYELATDKKADLFRYLKNPDVKEIYSTKPPDPPPQGGKEN